jgi:hypothetical protein
VGKDWLVAALAKGGVTLANMDFMTQRLQLALLSKRCVASSGHIIL